MSHEYDHGTQSASQLATAHENGLVTALSEPQQQPRVPVTENPYFQEAIDLTSPFYDLLEYAPSGEVMMCGRQVARYVLRESLPEEVHTQISTLAPTYTYTGAPGALFEYGKGQVTYAPGVEKYLELRRFIYNRYDGQLIGYIPEDVPIHTPGRKPTDYDPRKALPRAVFPHIAIPREPTTPTPESQSVRQGNVVFMEAWLREKQRQ